MKKSEANVKVILYILAILIVSLSLFFGLRLLNSTSSIAKSQKVALVKNQISQDFQLVKNEYGSEFIKEYDLGKDVKEICFISSNNQNELPVAFISDNPIVATAVE